MKNYALWLLLGVASTVGCGSAATSNAASRNLATDEGSRCPVLAIGSVQSWREVRGSGFTFCVPAEWRSTGQVAAAEADPHTWRGRGGWIRWSTRAPRPRELGNTMEPPRLGPSRRFAERIGGRPATLFVTEFHGRHYTGATWQRPPVYFEGETSDETETPLHLAIYRTVRFVEP